MQRHAAALPLTLTLCVSCWCRWLSAQSSHTSRCFPIVYRTAPDRRRGARRCAPMDGQHGPELRANRARAALRDAHDRFKRVWVGSEDVTMHTTNHVTATKSVDGSTPADNAEQRSAPHSGVGHTRCVKGLRSPGQRQTIAQRSGERRAGRGAGLGSLPASIRSVARLARATPRVSEGCTSWRSSGTSGSSCREVRRL